MQFEEDRTVETVGKQAGFVFSYMLFTTILFFALTLLEKMPASWSFWHILGVTAGITLFGSLLKRWLA